MYSRRSYEPAYARLTPVSGGISFESTYDSQLVAAFKMQIPADSRRWDQAGKRWIVAPQYTNVCAQLAETYLGVKVAIPAQSSFAPIKEIKLLKLEYLGRCKERVPGESSAFGWVNGGWSIVFPEPVLREWFEAIPQAPGEKPTLYAVLTVKQSASAEEIKKAFRRLAMQWHPDRCREPDAAEQFKIINHAYEILSDELKRKKYDAGLALEASLKTQQVDRYSRISYGIPDNAPSTDGYRSPLRCGWVLVEGVETLGRFNVSKITQWEDVTNSMGQVMVVSWPVGASQFVVDWR